MVNDKHEKEVSLNNRYIVEKFWWKRSPLHAILLQSGEVVNSSTIRTIIWKNNQTNFNANPNKMKKEKKKSFRSIVINLFPSMMCNKYSGWPLFVASCINVCFIRQSCAMASVLEMPKGERTICFRSHWCMEASTFATPLYTDFKRLSMGMVKFNYLIYFLWLTCNTLLRIGHEVYIWGPSNCWIGLSKNTYWLK